MLEYIWLGGNYELRSKIKVHETSFLCMNDLKNVPAWNYDGSSTSQTTGEHSEINLLPVSVYRNPLFKRRADIESLLVLCETRDQDGQPLATNNRFKANEIFEKCKEHEPWFGLEQEYFILTEEINEKIKNSKHEIFMLTKEMNKHPTTKEINELINEKMKNSLCTQGQYYCSVGGRNAFFRNIADRHMLACIEAGINISGTNAEVAPYQWEFQIGPCTGIQSGDQMWVARYLLEKIAEEEGCYIEWGPKPFDGINGSGCHANFSTKNMRDSSNGLSLIMDAISQLSQVHTEHMAVYGEDNDKRMSGQYETAAYETFSFDIDKPVNRGASIRIGYDTLRDKKGYFEDRRPASNCDPYLVTAAIANTCIK